MIMTFEEKLRANPALLAELQAYLEKATAEDAATTKQLERMKAEHKATQRSFDAHKLVPGINDGHLRAAVEQALAELPDEKLDDAELARLKRRHDAQQLVKEIVALRGQMTAANEALVQQKIEAAMANISVKEGARK